jgi:putative tryptophan/tyrosine transport system substrate-binding protein
MDRRNFLIGGLAALGAARVAQAQRTYRVTVLVHGPELTQRGRVDALRAGLKQHGYVEGRNLSLSVQWNEGGLERLPGLAAELLKPRPDVIVAAQRWRPRPCRSKRAACRSSSCGALAP